MGDWLSRFGGFGLIFAGWLLLTGLIPSAAGPADALRGAPVVAPPAPLPSGIAVPPRLIGSARQGLFGRTDETPSLAEPTATAEPTAIPTVAPAPTATPEEAEPAPAVPAPPEELPPPAPQLPPTDRITIGRIGVDVKVVDVGVRPGGEMETAAFAAGRLSFSAQAGQAGNAVIAGHNDVEGEVFRRLPELRPGDEIRLFRGETSYRYTVVVRTIVREEGASLQQRQENARWMEPTEGASVTLISCYPYRVDTHRVIVHGVLVAD